MKKYIVFGFISGAVISILYPEYYTLISFGEYMGIDKKLIMLISVTAYVVMAGMILFRLKSEFSFKNLIFLLIGSWAGIFVVIEADKLCYNIFPILSIKMTGIKSRVAFDDAFNFKDIHILVRYLGQSIIQLVSYAVACAVYRLYVNRDE